MARLTFDQYVVKFAIFLGLFVLFFVGIIPVQLVWFVLFSFNKKKMIEKDFNIMTPMEWFGKFGKNALDPNN